MRQIGTVPKRLDVKVLADYLLTLGMKTRVDEEADGWIVWIYHEDHFTRAREELQAYLNGPDDPRYQKAGDSRGGDPPQTAQNSTSSFARIIARFPTMWSYPGLRRRPLTIVLVGHSAWLYFLLQRSSNGVRGRTKAVFRPEYLTSREAERRAVYTKFFTARSGGS